jgi:hypothetical protein
MRGVVTFLIMVAFTIIIGFVFHVSGIFLHKDTNQSEGIIKIDSLSKANDSIKLKVEHLDSIKDAKVIEVSTLDNDSTIKLFYKLVSE